jgi:WD40 repeat protein
VLSDDGRLLAVPDGDGGLLVWDVVSGRRLLAPIRPPADLPLIFGPQEALRRIIPALSGNGRWLAGVVPSTGALGVWELPSGRPLHVTPRRTHGELLHLEFSPDGRRILTLCSDTTARLWDVETGVPAGPALRHLSRALRAALAPDGRQVATLDARRKVRIWDGPYGDLLDQFPVGTAFPGDPSPELWFSRDGSRLVLADSATARQVALPTFAVPADQVPPLIELLTGRRLDEQEDVTPLDESAILRDPARYRRAWLAWRGLDDDPFAQPKDSAQARESR